MTQQVRGLEYGRVTKSQRGKLGCRVFLRLADGGWHSTQQFDTHGLSPTETADAIDELKVWHSKWAARQTEFRAVVGVEVVIDGEVFRIVSCTIPPDRPYDDVEVMISVRRVVGAQLQKADGFPAALWFSSIDAVPGNSRIIQEVRNRLQESRDHSAADNAFKVKLNALVKG